MRRLIVGLLAVLLPAGSATAATVGGAAALQLAALVGAHQPGLSSDGRRALAALYDGNAVASGLAPIAVRADAVVCKASDVAINASACDLTFGDRTVTIKGGGASQLYAALTRAGVPFDGAAGTVYESLSDLDCTVDASRIAERDGGGATCTFTPGT